ncbi:nuclear mitotic apparatus protein 1-like isoform X2 [Myxocyprinus asiaticus]|uniref:nuclear mitotic apparatus protein 1-like isoform X2 n=1 Tax=Myxocyprinus asiaticus TaxID=70543 RepID=UPI002221BC6F|nr:nuclear mitotic apparatus protein 1-like isoform X2 [Myxocyprinus asiaticus]
MKLGSAKAGALLIWINGVCPEEPVGQFIHIKDGHQLLRISCKLQGKEPDEELKTLSLYNKVEIIFNILHNDFHLNTTQSSLILQKIEQKVDLELQLAKVALLLCYCSFKKDNLQPLSSNAQSVIVSMFNLVKDDADGLSLDKGLDQFLTQDSVMNSSTSSTESSGCSSFCADDESPIFGRFHRPPRVTFQELCTVACSSDGSPLQDIMSTPHFQLKRLRKELAHEGDVRDELEKELANQISIISEKEGLISQLQHRVDRLLREQGELEKDHKAALIELQEKNESLLHRVHEVLKQCQDLKTDNSQKEKKIDELTEENGTLAAQVRNTFCQLARAEEEVAKLTLTHEKSQAEWIKRREFIERELNEAVTHRVYLNEQVQILQGKISVLEDELEKAQSQERGEVMGPIMEWEKLKQELLEMSLKLAQLQDTISCLEKEKAEVEALLAQERCSFEQETTRLQTVVFDLENSVSSIRMEREALQEALMAQKEMLTSQISALESDVSRLQQVEIQLTAEIKISAELRQQRGELEGKVASLDNMVNALHTEIQGFEIERETQQVALNALMADLQNAQTTLQDYEKKLEEHQKVVEENASLTNEACTLRQEIDEHLQTIGDLQGQISILRQEKKEEENKVSQALTKIESVETKILELSEQISLKDEEITNLRNEFVSLDTELKLVKEENIEINERIKSNCIEHEDTIEKLQQELLSASSTASEKQEEILVLSAEVTSLKEQICHYNKNEKQEQQKLSVLEAEHNVLKENLTSLLNQLTEATTTTSQKESELISLKQELCLQETLREKSQELETARREEFERKVSELQAKILEVSTLASEREACVTSLRCEIKDQQLRAIQSEDDLRRELEKKVAIMQGQLETVSQDVTDKDHLLQSLDQKLRQMELLCQQKDKDVRETLQTKENLETKIAELLVEKQHLDESQQNLEKEREHLSAEVSSLKEEICRSLENDQQKKQEVSLLKDEHNTLKDNLASLQNQLVEFTTKALQKESELLLVQQELCQQEILREKAQELETVMREEFERKVSELQAKILEISTLASEREAQISYLQNEMTDQQLKSKQSEDDLRTELEEKVCTLQGELDAAICGAANKDRQLESFDQKLRQMELLCQQKDKDVRETLQTKENLETKIAELLVEKQHLDESQQNLEKEREHLSAEVSSLKEEICRSLENDQQKKQEVSLLKDEHNALKDNLASLQNQLVEFTTKALQKESELLLVQQELCQQEILREKAQELETVMREEFERKVSELQAKILEISTLASEREAQISYLQNEMTDQQLKSKQSEDDLRTELEEKVCTLQGELDAAICGAANKDRQLESFDQKLRQMELLCQQKDKDVRETLQTKENLETKIAELLVEKQHLDESQQNLEKEREHLSAEVSSLKEEICRSLENDQQKKQEVSLLKDEHNTLKENLASLQNQLVEFTTKALQKESELLLVQQELCQQETLREKAQELETVMREEFERKVSELQAKILEISTLASEREAQISYLQNEMTDQQLKSKQSEDDLRTELEEKVCTLQGELDAAICGAANKDHQLESFDQKLRQMELLCQQKDKDVRETLQTKENLETKIAELLVEKQHLDESQKNLEKEREHLSAEVSSLKEEICRSLENDQQKKQEVSLLKDEHNALKENLASLQNQLVEFTTKALQKESELLLVQQELCQQETLREKAQELETASCEEFERKVNELQAKIIEVSTLASEREACMTSLQCEIKDQQLRAKQSEDDLRRELEEHVGNLQRQLEAANCGAADKDHQLESLEQKLRQMELLCQQKDKDVRETLQTKENLETKIAELLVEKQHLDESQQNLEKEREHLSAEVSSLKEEICRSLENDQQKKQEVSLLKDEHNTLKENLASLQNQLVEFTTKALQKESELLLVQQELCQQDTLREKAQELETVMREEFERKVSELQAKILEISTLASEREAQISYLQNEMTDQQLKSKQSEDDLRTELEEKVCTLQGELDAAICGAANKDHQLESFDQKLRQKELLCQQKDKDILETHHAKEDLEKKIVELLVEKQQLLECQQNLVKERDQLSAEVSSLKEQISCSLLNEQQKQQEVSVLKDELNILKENLAALQSQLEEVTATAFQKESKLLLVQQELCQQETLREKAQELETVIHEEFKRKFSELQAKILEDSTLASEKEAQISSLQDDLKDQQLKLKQSEVDLCRELEEKVGALQGQLENASCDTADKDRFLQSLDHKLRQMELLCQEKEKDVLETNQANEDLEKRIVELLVKTQQLEGYQQNLEILRKERDNLSTEVTSLKEEICHYQENQVQKQQEMSVLEVNHNILKENLAALNSQLEKVTSTTSKKESELLLLQNELCQQENFREKAQELEKNVSELQAKILEVSTLASEREAQISYLQNEMKDQQLRSKQSEDDLRRELEKKVAILQGQLETVSQDVTDKDHLLQSLDQKLREMELLCQQKENDTIETHQAKEDLMKRIVELHADKHKLDGCQQNMEILRKERDHLCSLSQSLQRECDASQRIRAELELKVEDQSGSILTLENAARQWEEQNKELLEQLKRKSEAVEHYKTQVENARSHYIGKKQLLLEAQEINKTLEQTLESSKREVKALETEMTLARMELDQAKTKEKNLVAKVKRLEAQVDFADRQLREQKKMTDDIGEVRDRVTMCARVPEARHDISNDSLEFDLNDSLGAGSHSAVPGESSTPLVRSSERLAAKRRALGAESLETLYFTPMSQQGNKWKGDRNDATEQKLETSITSFGDLDSAKKLTASARKRRTTQVINITAKTSGNVDGEVSFSSLHSARTQPNLAIHHSRPVSMDLSEESGRAVLSKADKLESLPGYRRSSVHNVVPARATSTFCIGAENEPEHAADDWIRIAELQARNKACLPHLKSSYPLESRPSLGLPSFTVTDDDLRMGDPDETIRRASMIPSQLRESLNSRRFSLAPGGSSSQVLAQSQPQRSTMLPGQIRSSTAAYRASQVTKTTSNVRSSENVRSPLAPKRPVSQLQGPDTPEAKKTASCFPRPMTPKGRHTNSQNKPPNTPAERRQSIMFSVLNTPKTSTRGDSRLQRGLNKLRNSARKSPAMASRALRSAVSAADGRSPLDSTRRKSPRNKSPKSSNAKKMKFRIKV